MSDLSNLLGDVYGDHSPDAAPVRREPSASERLDGSEDLTAALAAALATPAPAPVAVAPAPAPVEDVPLPTLAQALAEIPAAAAPKAGWASSAPAPAPAAPTMVSAPAAGGFWTPGDDDIFPMPRGGKKSKR